ncbi:DUF1048 domain-containing protein [Paenibacillus athensensis]|uniref:Cytoplasmic protein n=1 Tax=Paenibacillus athensensis TaxID=1967502 RepID=A0A4Y8PWE7_9BACL|nr:DUF1048 domain-containing protein [Paenibacillus athensensis]MCD1260579.1 DUF1048 domain-containing protein [Paenibacillus athensensis]
MLNALIKLLIGDLEQKRGYNRLRKRVKGLPDDYRFAFQKMQRYMYSVGAPGGDMTIFTDLTVFTDLVDLLEISAAEGKQVLEVTGSDVALFCDEFMRASAARMEGRREKLNQDIADKLKKEGR